MSDLDLKYIQIIVVFNRPVILERFQLLNWVFSLNIKWWQGHDEQNNESLQLDDVASLRSRNANAREKSTLDNIQLTYINSVTADDS